MPRARMVVTGEKALLARLKGLASERTAKSVCRKSVNAGAQVLVQAIRSEVSDETGALRRAITKKVTGSNFRYNGIVGADTAIVAADGDKPANYDHLVERGHVTTAGAQVQPHPFVSTGFAKARGAAQARYTEQMAQGIEAIALKGG